jgi:hypothetical protein
MLKSDPYGVDSSIDVLIRADLAIIVGLVPSLDNSQPDAENA